MYNISRELSPRRADGPDLPVSICGASLKRPSALAVTTVGATAATATATATQLLLL